MENQPLVSVIMPCYNTEKYITQSIQSVLNQTYTNWELIITDGPSLDETATIVKTYCEQDPRICLITPTKRNGIADARHRSIQNAKGDFLAFLDSDDIWVSDKLEKQVAFMQSKGYAFTYGNYEIINAEGIATGKTVCNGGVVDYDKYLRNTIIGCGSVMLDKNKIGPILQPAKDVNDDMALWCSILRTGIKAYPMDELLYQYRIRNDGASSHRMEMIRSVWKVYRKQEKLSLPKSIICFVGYAFNAIKKRLLK